MSMKAIIAKVNGPQDMANLDPRDMVGRISVGDQDIARVFNIYISCGSHDFKEVFSHYKYNQSSYPISIKT